VLLLLLSNEVVDSSSCRNQVGYGDELVSEGYPLASLEEGLLGT
jgi:hypothetical protein